MKLRKLFESAMAVGFGVVAGSLFLSTIAGVSYSLYNQALSGKAREVTQLNNIKKTELQSLAKDVFKKAEFEDGKAGISLEDMAKMANELGYSEKIYEGDNLFLDVTGPWGITPPKLSLRVVKSSGDYLSGYGCGTQIDEQKARRYVSSQRRD
jgi:hypothetical protein